MKPSPEFNRYACIYVHISHTNWKGLIPDIVMHSAPTPSNANTSQISLSSRGLHGLSIPALCVAAHWL